MVNKEELSKVFQKDWKKHYQIDSLVKKGFQRKQCSNCQRFFWSIDSSRKTCADSSCMGYEFIGKPTKKLGYTETWKEIEKYFKKTGHTPINRFPVVARWRDDLYFTVASIIDFQPYVVRGELAPPANPLIVPQTCFRFNDIGNVGVTGRHYSCFVMFGQHAFNSGAGKPKYWKDEALENDFNYLNKVLGARKEDITFNEDVWAGGGTFGPCMEWMVNGVELGNCVFMQYEETENGGYKELSTKVVDMGAGLERLAWFTNGTPTSYDVTFDSLVKKLKKSSGIQLDEELFLRYAKISGSLDNEGQKVKEEREMVARKLGISEKELFEKLLPMQALYAICDHTKAILYGITDGQLPSNAGGGYNLRLLLRRIFGFNEEFDFELDYDMIIKEHVKMLKGFDNSVGEISDTVIDVIHEEEKKYQNLKETGRKKIQTVVERLKKDNKPLQKTELVTLYESHGIPFELSKEIAEEHGVKVEEIYNFYDSIALKNEKHKEKKLKTNLDLSKFPHTKQMYYDELYQDDFSAKVIGTIENYVILDQTLFYPEGGGQDGDHGILNGVEVLDTIKQGGVILHVVKDAKSFKTGTTVSGKIDRVRRENLMHNHTCTHLLNAACRELLGNHIWQAGAHKEVEKAHLDITHYKKVTEEELDKITKIVIQGIKKQIPVKKFVIDRGQAERKYGFKIYQGGFVPGKELRLVEIVGKDIQACGGTHINNTKEIGDFAILKVESIQDGIQRISFCTGEYAKKQRDEEKLTSQLQSEITNLKSINEASVAQFKAKINSIQNSTLKEGLNKSLKLVSDELGKQGDKSAIEMIEKLAEKEIQSKKAIIAFSVNASPSQVSKASQNLINKHPTITTAIASEQNQLVTIFSGKNASMNALKVLDIAKKHGAKGGGSEVTAQAKFSSKEDINKFFNEVKK